MALRTKDFVFGKFQLRVREAASGGWDGIIVGQMREVFHGDTFDDVLQKLQRHALTFDKAFIGFEGARSKFLEVYPDGFASEALTGRRGGEIYDKRVAAFQVKTNLPLENVHQSTFHPEKIVRAFQAGKMVDRFDIDALRRVLNSQKGFPLFWALACFASDEPGMLKAACSVLEARFHEHGIANWSILTYLAAMWKPDQHAYLPRTTAQEFARCVGHPFAEIYQSKPISDVYWSYLDMLSETGKSLADLGTPPQDFIDLESYIHLVVRECR